VERRAVLDLLLGQGRPQPRGPGHRLEGEGRDEHLPAGQPRAGVDDDVANGPALIVKVGVRPSAITPALRPDRPPLELPRRSHLSPPPVADVPRVTSRGPE